MVSQRQKFAVVLLVLATAVGVTAVVLGQPEKKREAKDKRPLAAERLKAVKKGYDLLFEPSRQGTGVAPLPEAVYLWSRRWLEAELDTAETVEARRAAYGGHQVRMKELDERYRKVTTHVPPLQLAAAECFRLEAEFWVARASE